MYKLATIFFYKNVIITNTIAVVNSSTWAALVVVSSVPPHPSIMICNHWNSLMYI